VMLDDEKGELRALLQCSKSGEASFDLRGTGNQPKVSLGNTAQGAGLFLSGPATRGALMLGTDGVAMLNFLGGDEKPRVLLGSRQDGSASVDVLDATGKK